MKCIACVLGKITDWVDEKLMAFIMRISYGRVAHDQYSVLVFNGR